MLYYRKDQIMHDHCYNAHWAKLSNLEKEHYIWCPGYSCHKTPLFMVHWTCLLCGLKGERESFQAGDEHGYSITRADDFLIKIIEDNYSQLI